MGEVDDGLDDGLVGERTADPCDEAAVNLHCRHRQLLEIRERRVAGAEVVECDLHPQPAQRRQCLHRTGKVFQQARFGDLEADVVSLHQTERHCVAHLAIDVVAVGELLRGEVHPDPQGVGVVLVPPTSSNAHGLTEDPVANRRHQPRRFGERQEVGRCHQATDRMLPANQGFHADNAPVAQVDRGLHVEAQLVAGNRCTKLVLGSEAVNDVGAEARLVTDCRPAHGCLCPPAGKERLLQQVAGQVRTGMVSKARARLDRQHQVAQHHRLAYSEQEPLGCFAGVVEGGGRHHRDECVTLCVGKQ